ncbi:MAG: T9SS type A sorting domain-containing protein [Candidatus Eisenbacteria bacterium]
MSRAILALVAVAAAATLARGDQPPAPSRVAAPRAAATVGAGVLPRFALFGWVSPPESFASAARYAELADAGFSVVLPAWEDRGAVAPNLDRLAWTRDRGARCLLLDLAFDRVDPAVPASLRWADSLVARYAADPAFLGWYLGDEPARDRWPQLRGWFDLMRARDPAHPAWNNLLGRMAFDTRAEYEQYLRDYVRDVAPSALCSDHYDFRTDGDRRQLVECVATLAAVAREHGLPFWGIVQLVRHRGYRDVDEGMLRWQMGHWLAYGARGIGTFTYWTPAPDSAWEWHDAMLARDGTRTPLYDVVRRVNAHAAPAGLAIAGMTWVSAEMAGSVAPGGTPFAPDDAVAAVEGRAMLGTFVDSLARTHVLVVNSDSLAARTVTLALAGAGRRAWQLGDDGTWTPAAVGADGRCALALGAGDFALLRLSDAGDVIAAGNGRARFVAGPNPARGRVRFTLASLARGARLEVLDLSGRRVWARDWTAGGSGMAEWHGERDGGGTVPPGVYLARLEDGFGVVARRVTWLGSR